jgi:hypothetical protein
LAYLVVKRGALFSCRVSNSDDEFFYRINVPSKSPSRRSMILLDSLLKGVVCRSSTFPIWPY